MDVGSEIRRARARARLSQHALARAAGTSQSTLSNYESGRKQPSAATFARILAAAGGQLAVLDAPGGRHAEALETSGRRLADVLALAEELPFRRAGPLRFPRLPA